MRNANESFAYQRGLALVSRIEADAANQALLDHENNIGQTKVAIDYPEKLGLKEGLTRPVTLNELVTARAATERLIETVEDNYALNALSEFGKIVGSQINSTLTHVSKTQEVFTAMHFLKDPSSGLKQALVTEVLKTSSPDTSESYKLGTQVREGVGILRHIFRTSEEARELLNRYELQTMLEQHVMDVHSQTRQSLAEHAAATEIRSEKIGEFVNQRVAEMIESGVTPPPARLSEEALNVALYHSSAVRSTETLRELGQALKDTPLPEQAKQAVLNRLYGATDYLHSRQISEAITALQTEDGFARLQKGEIPTDPSIFRRVLDMPEDLTFHQPPLQQFRGIEGGSAQSKFVREQLMKPTGGTSIAEVVNSTRYAQAMETLHAARQVEVLTNDLSRSWNLSPNAATLTGPENQFLEAFSTTSTPAISTPAAEDLIVNSVKTVALSM